MSRTCHLSPTLTRYLTAIVSQTEGTDTKATNNTMKAFSRLIIAMATQAVPFSMARVHFSPSPHSSVSPTSLNLSHASAAVLLVRGGDDATEAVVLKDFSKDALGFFGGIRTPATFLAGSSLAAIFTLKSSARKLYSHEEKSKMSRLEIALVKIYHLVSLSAFVLSLNTIMTSTSAYTSVLHGRFDPKAETAYLLLKREFEYEFISCRWSFLTSMFCFLGMIMSRILIEFELLQGSDKKKKDSAIVIVCSIGALATHLLSYINQNLWCWQSLIGMGANLAQVSKK